MDHGWQLHLGLAQNGAQGPHPVQRQVDPLRVTGAQSFRDWQQELQCQPLRGDACRGTSEMTSCLPNGPVIPPVLPTRVTNESAVVYKQHSNNGRFVVRKSFANDELELFVGSVVEETNANTHRPTCLSF
jgi:hypothetical protein